MNRPPDFNNAEKNERHPLWALLDAISAEHAKQGARITELRAKIATLDLAPPVTYRCDECGVTLRTRAALQEHAYRRHDGPLPDSDRAAEIAAGLVGVGEHGYTVSPSPASPPHTTPD